MRKEIWTYMPDPTSDSVTDYRRGRGLADDIGMEGGQNSNIDYFKKKLLMIISKQWNDTLHG